jgi:hypothetical protein
MTPPKTNKYENYLKLNTMTEQEVIYKVCDRMINTMYNELDYYMFEELGYTETDDKYVEDADKLITKVINTLIK